MGDIIRGAADRYLVKAEPSPRAVPPRKTEKFLRLLAESCNVTRSARLADLAYSTLYDMRRRDAAFAARWQAALDAGYHRLEMALVRTALAAVEGLPGENAAAADDAAAAEPDEPIQPMTVDQAIHLLKLHHASVQGGKARSIRPGNGSMPTSEETDAAILRRYAVLRRQRGWHKE